MSKLWNVKKGGARRQHGFSLIELLISGTILLFVIFFAVKIFDLYSGGARLRKDMNRIEQEKETVGSLIRPDFENAGYNLISHQNHAYGSQDASFVSDSRYQALGRGQITRKEATGGPGEYIESNTMIGSETGSATATFNRESGISLVGESAGYVTLAVVADENRRFYLLLDIAGETQTLVEHTPGTSYRVSLLPDPDGKAVLVTQLGATAAENRQVVRVVNHRLPAGTIKVFAYLVNENDQMRVELKGAPLIDGGDSRTLTNRLFADRATGAFVADPVYQTPDGSTTIISGALDSRVGFLQETAEDFRAAKDIIIVQEPSLPGTRPGDYGVLLDYETGNSALLKITAIIEDAAGRQIFSVSPVTADDPAWGRFYSTDEALNTRFNRGSRFVKLAEPITYRRSSARGGGNRLIRQSGNRSETVAFAVESFDVRQTAGGRTYQIELVIDSDAAASGGDGPRTRFSYTAQPRVSSAQNQSE